MRRNTSQKGFTLIELLIVIAIIGILAAVLIPNLLAARSRAFDTAAQSCGRAIATAQEIHAIDNDGAYAAALADLSEQDMVTDVCNGITVNGGVWADNEWNVAHPDGNNTYDVGPAGIQAQ